MGFGIGGLSLERQQGIQGLTFGKVESLQT